MDQVELHRLHGQDRASIIRVEHGVEVDPGRYRYSVPAYGVEGCSHQPLLDACRQLKSLRPETRSRQIALYRRGRDEPDLFCTVEAGADTTVVETNTRGPYFAKFKAFDPSKWPVVDGQSGIEGERLTEPPETRKTAVPGKVCRPAIRSGEASDDYPGVVAMIDGGRSRVIVGSTGIQWIVQHREGNRWVSRSHCCTKEALQRCCDHDPYPALAALPDRIGDPIVPATDNSPLRSGTQEAAE